MNRWSRQKKVFFIPITDFRSCLTVEKAAGVYAQARAMNGGSDRFLNTIPDEGLRGIAAAYGLPVNEEYL